MNTEFYKQLLNIKRSKECSIRELAKECGLCYGTLIEFFNTEKQFRPLRDTTMAKIHNNLGISYEVMEEYNKEIYKERGE
jgi:hypothetical protein